MKKFFGIIIESTIDLFDIIKRFIKNNLMTFANAIELIIPYVMYFIGQHATINRGDASVGGELFIPIAFIIIIFYLKSAANKTGKGITIPVPNKRFTQVDEDGEVSIEHERLQELILYIADIEDWLARKGLL